MRSEVRVGVCHSTPPTHPLPRSSQRAEWPAARVRVYYCTYVTVSRQRAHARARAHVRVHVHADARAHAALMAQCASAGALRACLAAAASSRVCPSFLVGAVRLMQSGSCVCARERARRVRTRGGGQDSTSASRGRLVLLRSQMCSGPRRTAGAPVSALVHACAHGCARFAPTTYLPSQARSPERRCRAQTSPTAHARQRVSIYIWRARQTASVVSTCRSVRLRPAPPGALRAWRSTRKRWRARGRRARTGRGGRRAAHLAWRTMGVLRKNELGGLSLCAASAAAPAVAPTAAAADAPAQAARDALVPVRASSSPCCGGALRRSVRLAVRGAQRVPHAVWRARERAQTQWSV